MKADSVLRSASQTSITSYSLALWNTISQLQLGFFGHVMRKGKAQFQALSTTGSP